MEPFGSARLRSFAREWSRVTAASSLEAALQRVGLAPTDALRDFEQRCGGLQTPDGARYGLCTWLLDPAPPHPRRQQLDAATPLVLACVRDHDWAEYVDLAGRWFARVASRWLPLATSIDVQLERLALAGEVEQRLGQPVFKLALVLPVVDVELELPLVPEASDGWCTRRWDGRALVSAFAPIAGRRAGFTRLSGAPAVLRELAVALGTRHQTAALSFIGDGDVPTALAREVAAALPHAKTPRQRAREVRAVTANLSGLLEW